LELGLLFPDRRGDRGRRLLSGNVFNVDFSDLTSNLCLHKFNETSREEYP